MPRAGSSTPDFSDCVYRGHLLVPSCFVLTDSGFDRAEKIDSCQTEALASKPVMNSLKHEKPLTHRPSWDNGPCHCSEPDTNKSDDHAQRYIEQCRQQLAVLKEAQRLVFKSGECRVSPNETDGDQISPIGTPVRFGGQHSENHPDQERARDVDHKSPIGKSSVQSPSNKTPKPEAQNRT